LQPFMKEYRNILFYLLFTIIFLPNSSFIGKAGILPFYSIESAIGAVQINPLKRISNPAITAYYNDYSLNLSYSPSVFGLKELSPASLLVLMPFSDAIKGSAKVDYVGNNLYSEFTFNASGSYSINEKIHLGVSACNSRLQIQKYHDESIFMLNLGGVFEVNDVLSTGFSLSNLNRASFEGGDKSIGQKAVFGASIHPKENLFFDIDMVILLERSSGIAFACRYDVSDLASIRLAYLSNPAGFEAGIKINPTGNFSIISEFNYHSFLGFSSDFGISIHL